MKIAQLLESSSVLLTLRQVALSFQQLLIDEDIDDIIKDIQLSSALHVIELVVTPKVPYPQNRNAKVMLAKIYNVSTGGSLRVKEIMFECNAGVTVEIARQSRNFIWGNVIQADDHQFAQRLLKQRARDFIGFMS